MASTVIEARGRDSAAVAVVDNAGPAVSWAAVIGGAFTIAALSVVLIAFGAGFGLSSVSPWPSAGVTLTTFTVMTAVWLIVVQWLSSGIGGYVAGRLSPFSGRVHAKESYFRDTAHGLLAWAVASVVTAAVLASALTLLLGGTAAATASGAAQGGAQAASQEGGATGKTGYMIDTLFRSEKPDANANGRDVRAETTRILVTDIAGRDVPAADKTYVASLIAARTGISQDEAQKRVEDTIVKLRHAADETRKAAMKFALFTGFSMLIGAFIAGVAGKIGGHHRDHLAAL